MQLGDLFDLSLVGRRDAVGLEHDGPDGIPRTLTFGDVDARANRTARGLASFKVPRGFVRVDALPRSALGKVQKHLLPPWGGA
jgi:malonyl-CoA/methylmalonyl-CoA synthetase